jgi:hypothetical protein
VITINENEDIVVKVFTSTDYKELESKINDWLAGMLPTDGESLQVEVGPISITDNEAGVIITTKFIVAEPRKLAKSVKK